MASQLASPLQVSRSSSSSSLSSRRAAKLTLDLSDLPQLSEPTPPSNTLIITNLHDPSIFHPASLEQIKQLLLTHAPLHSFAPLKSFRRLVVSFYTISGAIAVRAALDGSQLMGLRIRVYFGQPTPTDPQETHLALPKSDKLFFISPPPSPPHGWQMRNEEPPNKEVHAEDLAAALARLNSRPTYGGPPPASQDTDMRDADAAPSPPATGEDAPPPEGAGVTRRRTGSTTIVFDPQANGGSPDLPAIAVEDVCASPVDLGIEEQEEVPRVFAHTSRPPTELMMH